MAKMDDALQVLEDRGFFYQENADIGNIVKYLYDYDLVRDEHRRFDVKVWSFPAGYPKRFCQ